MTLTYAPRNFKARTDSRLIYRLRLQRLHIRHVGLENRGENYLHVVTQR
jgi:hypothetical protein